MRPANATGRATPDVQDQLRAARSQLLGGRGPGASADEIAAHSRLKAVQGAVPAVHRLAATQRDAALRRGDPVGAVEGVHITQVAPPVRTTPSHPPATLLRRLLRRR
ncbi:MAG TPA: hypothetical protein VF288_11645 [Mycobacteriales bacterium]